MTYRIDWLYSDLREGVALPDRDNFEIHFRFLLEFPDVPPGKGHVAHFCFNVISSKLAAERGIDKVSSRNYLVSDSFSHQSVVKQVEEIVADAFAEGTRHQALDKLDKYFSQTDRDYSAEFEADVLDTKTLLSMIHDAFDGVTRDDGITLHEATLIEEHWELSPEQREAARALDTERRLAGCTGRLHPELPSLHVLPR